MVTPIKAKMQSSSGKEVSIDLPLLLLSTEERKKIAWKNLGLFWGIALFCLFLPIVHFVAFPFFLLFGPYMAFKKLRETEHIDAMSFKCPECSKDLGTKRQVAKNPLLITCPQCLYNLKTNWR